jgi:hypothetical protein
MKIYVTEDDWKAGRLVGAKGHEVMEAAIHSALDRAGIPREGRGVWVNMETITIELPPGYTMNADDEPVKAGP